MDFQSPVALMCSEPPTVNHPLNVRGNIQTSSSVLLLTNAMNSILMNKRVNLAFEQFAVQRWGAQTL